MLRDANTGAYSSNCGSWVKDAVKYLLRALEIGERSGFNDTLPIAATKANLARAYEQLEMFAEAEKHMAEALAIVELRCGKNSTRAAGILASHAPLLRRLGRKSEARAAETRARNIAGISGFAAFAGRSIDVADFARRD